MAELLSSIIGVKKPLDRGVMAEPLLMVTPVLIKVVSRWAMVYTINGYGQPSGEGSLSRLLLVRHGITESNSAHRFAGYSDVELSAAGYRQVEQLRDRLVDDKIDAVYSSDLR